MPECRQVFYWWHFAANLSFDAWNASSLSPFSSSTLFVWTLCELQRWTTVLFLFMFHWPFFVVILQGLDLTFKCMKEFFDQTNTVPPSWQSVILNNYCPPQSPFHPLPIWQVERKLNILKWQCITFSSPTYPQPPPQLSLPSPHILPFSLQPLTSPTPSLVSLSTAVHRGLAVCVTDARACDARSQLSKRARVHSVSCWPSSSSSSSCSCAHCLSILQLVLLVHKTIPLLVNEARMVGLVNKTMLKIILMVLVHKTMVWGWGGHIMVGLHPTILATTDNEANWIKVQHLIQRNWFLVLPIIK